MQQEAGLVRRFSILHRQSGIYLDRKLRALDIKVGQFLYLVCICEQPGLSQEQLASLLRIDKGSVARTVKQLVQDGYLRREVCPRDRRQYQLYPTEKAWEAHAHIGEITRQWEQRLVQQLTDIEVEVLKGLLDKVAHTLDTLP